jgi:hypothetical protein
VRIVLRANWNVGTLEYWVINSERICLNIKNKKCSDENPSFHYSKIPLFQYDKQRFTRFKA